MIDFLGQLWAIVKPYRLRLFLGVAAGFVAGIVEPLLMVSAKVVVDVLFPTGDSQPLLQLPQWAPAFIQDGLAELSRNLGNISQHPRSLLLVVCLVPVVMLLRGVLGYINVYFLSWSATHAITDLRTRLFQHLFGLPLSFFHRLSTGELMSRVMSDVAALQQVLTGSIATVIKDPVTLVSLLAFLLWQAPKLTLASLVVIPVCVIPIVIYSGKVRRATRLMQTKFAEISRVLHESFTGARIIKAYNLEERAVSQFAQISRENVSHQMRVVRSSEVPGPLIEFCGAIGVAVLLLYVGLAPKARAISPGDLVMVVGSVFMMYRPIKNLTRLHVHIVQARAASERVFEFLAMRSDLPDPPRPVPLRAAEADIEFDHIHFQYRDQPVLQNVSLKIKAGTMVALVGSSGSGKTTMTNLLLRFYDPQHGAIRIGGTDIRQVATRDLRNQIAVVTQEVILFDDTVRNNIAVGRPGATDAEIVAAAQHAHADEFIMERPEGYETQIGEKGVTLSGGQRQRIAIARAVLRNAPILVLDEATSALDTKSERIVQAALDELMKGRTTLCIAHRLSTVQSADLIIVMDQGRIVESGRHTDLLSREGVYHKLYQMQFQAGTEN